MAAEAPISRAVLSQTVKDRLLAGILDGRYPPGSRIVETRVARELGTSQTPVREALRDLEALGLVEISAFRGARVRRPSRDELLEAFDVRAELEVLATRTILGRLTPDDFERLRGYHHEMRRAAEAGDIVADAAADAAFHAYLVDRAENATLSRVWRLLEPHSRTFITLTASGTERAAIADLHLPIYEALERGDLDEVERTMRGHFAAAKSMLGEHWPDDAPELVMQLDNVAADRDRWPTR
ncbi:MAG TPA: GntR family transcriptional regulator [Candidatus Limnocylindrales bacterium]